MVTLPHKDKYVTGDLSKDEEWTNEKYAVYKHLFLKGEEIYLRSYSCTSIIPNKYCSEL
jgi:hypothetical protein